MNECAGPLHAPSQSQLSPQVFMHHLPSRSFRGTAALESMNVVADGQSHLISSPHRVKSTAIQSAPDRDVNKATSLGSLPPRTNPGVRKRRRRVHLMLNPRSICILVPLPLSPLSHSFSVRPATSNTFLAASRGWTELGVLSRRLLTTPFLLCFAHRSFSIRPLMLAVRPLTD